MSVCIFSEVRAESLDRRWPPLPGARGAPGAAPEAPPGSGRACPPAGRCSTRVDKYSKQTPT
eukprot:4059671-Pyramimonas_sp.AAC.1